MNPDSFGNVFRPRKPVHYLRQRKSIHILHVFTVTPQNGRLFSKN